jgi:HAD superfamily hydrolase (TIGR01484 family)
MGLKLIAFDLDGTLAPSKGPISCDMAKALKSLLDITQVCIISGGTQDQIMSQVVSRLPAGANLRNLHLMPTSGARYLKRHFGRWRTIYSEDFTSAQVERVISVLHISAALLGYWPENPYGEVIDNRRAQITFSALGQNAPIEIKEAWDPDGSKREKMRSAVASMIPEFDVRSGGSTSIDITKLGIDKSYGIDELSKRARIAIGDILFVGDRLDPGGNDYPVIRTGVDFQHVLSPEETLVLIRNLL